MGAMLARPLRKAARLPDEERLAISLHSLVEERFTWERIAKQMHAVYRWVLGEGPQPGCIRS